LGERLGCRGAERYRVQAGARGSTVWD
jgi:hypothetical protein